MNARRLDWRPLRAVLDMLSADERFWVKVDAATGSLEECWEWRGALTQAGYGQGVDHSTGRFWLAHRVAFEQLRGSIPDGLHIDHLCRNRLCVNPWHLEPVTNRENVRRGMSGELKTECANGHPYTPANVYLHQGRHRQCRVCGREGAARRRREAMAAA